MSNPRLTSAHKRKSPAQRALAPFGAFFGGIYKFLRKDLISTGLLIASIALIFTFFNLLKGLDADTSGTGTSLSQVQLLAKDKKVASATMLDRDHRVLVTTTDGGSFYADYPSSDSATRDLLQTFNTNGATVTIDPQSSKPLNSTVAQFLLPILILVCLFAFFTRLAASSDGGISSFSGFAGRGKKKKKGTKGPISFDSVAGAGDALNELKEIRDFLANPDKYKASGAAAPKGILLVGPPGTGKTLLAKATAGEADAAFFTASGAEFVESLVGVGAARVRDLFAKARKAAPAIVFIDEIDAAGRKRGAGVGQGNDEREQTLNQMLVEMDGFGGDSGVIVMGATNRPDILDPALLRPGRFDRQIVIDVPDVHGRLEILNLHARGREFAENVDLAEIARMCPGFSGAELANLMNEAALLTVREAREKIDQPTLEEAIDRVTAGPAKKHILTEDERWLIATHEAGHAVVTRALGQTTSVQKLSIVARGRQLGTSAAMLADKDAVMLRRTDLERQLATILAGTMAEIIAFEEESTGISDDIHAATNLARQMVTSYGMSPILGHVTIGEPAGEVFLGAALADLGSTGPKALDVIDDETERFVREAEARAEYVLRMNWGVVDATARALIVQETLSGLALEAMLSPVVTVDIHQIPLEDGGDRGDRGATKS